MELILTIALTHPASRLAPTTSAGRLPQPIRLPIARSRGFHPASGTIRPSDDSPGVASHFAARLIGSLTPVPPGDRTSPPGVTSRSSVPCRPQTPWCGGWMRSAFAPIVRARPCPTFGRPVHHGGGPPRLRPGTSPQAFRIPPRGGHPALWLPSRAEYDGRSIPLAVSAVSSFVPV